MLFSMKYALFPVYELAMPAMRGGGVATARQTLRVYFNGI